VIDVPPGWRLVVLALAFGTLPAVVLVGRLTEWWTGSSPAAVLLRSHWGGRRAQASRVTRRAARRTTQTPAGVGRAPDRPAPAGHHRHDRVGGA